MTPVLLLVILLPALWPLRVCFVRRATIAAQAERITELECDLEQQRAQNKNRFRPAELPGWVTEDSDEQPMIQGRPKMLALPPVIDLPRDAAHTAQQPVVGGPREPAPVTRRVVDRNERSRVPAGIPYSYGVQR